MKKAIKNIALMACVVAMLFTLSGCGKEENDKEADKKEEQKTQFSMGKWEDNVYTNDFLGLKFNLPEGWKASSDEEIAKMMNVGKELLNDDQKALTELAEKSGVYYMSVSDPSTGNNIIVLTEKTAVDVNTDYYINQLKTQLTSVSSIKYQIGETSKATVAGREYDTLTASASMYGYTTTQRYYIYKIDKYFVGIIVTSNTGESAIDEMMNSFE